MVFSDANVDPWLYRQGFDVDSWLLQDTTFSHDNNLLTKALHTTVTSSSSPSSVLFDSVIISNTLSDQETGHKQKRNCFVPVSSNNKSTKQRRSRASKKSMTTFIAADPSNFRQMVHQVTGAKFTDDDSNSSVVFAPIVKPEPVRLVNRVPPCGNNSDSSMAVPTLDTSAFLSNHHQENLVAGSKSVKANVTVDAGGSAVDFDTYPNFPTLESWKVM